MTVSDGSCFIKPIGANRNRYYVMLELFVSFAATYIVYSVFSGYELLIIIVGVIPIVN